MRKWGSHSKVISLGGDVKVLNMPDTNDNKHSQSPSDSVAIHQSQLTPNHVLTLLTYQQVATHYWLQEIQFSQSQLHTSVCKWLK